MTETKMTLEGREPLADIAEISKAGDELLAVMADLRQEEIDSGVPDQEAVDTLVRVVGYLRNQQAASGLPGLVEAYRADEELKAKEVQRSRDYSLLREAIINMVSRVIGEDLVLTPKERLFKDITQAHLEADVSLSEYQRTGEAPVVRDWFPRGNCAQEPRYFEIFFPPDDPKSETPPEEPEEDRLAREGKARRICSTCVVRVSCLDGEISGSPDVGIRGGLTQEERRSIHKVVVRSRRVKNKPG